MPTYKKTKVVSIQIKQGIDTSCEVFIGKSDTEAQDLSEKKIIASLFFSGKDTTKKIPVVSTAAELAAGKIAFNFPSQFTRDLKVGQYSSDVVIRNDNRTFDFGFRLEIEIIPTESTFN